MTLKELHTKVTCLLNKNPGFASNSHIVDHREKIRFLKDIECDEEGLIRLIFHDEQL